MAVPVKVRVTSVVRVIAFLLAMAVALYALYLLVIGVRWVTVTAVAPGEPLGPPQVEYRPFPLAVVPLTAAILVAIGLRRRGLLALAWMGTTILVVFAVLTVFSVGLALIPAVGLLLITLTLVTVLTVVRAPQRRGRRPA